MVCSVFLVTSSPSVIVYTILVMSCLSTLMLLKTSIAFLWIWAERLIIYYTPSNHAVRSLKLFCLLHIVSHFMELFPGFFVLNRLDVSKLRLIMSYVKFGTCLSFVIPGFYIVSPVFRVCITLLFIYLHLLLAKQLPQIVVWSDIVFCHHLPLSTLLLVLTLVISTILLRNSLMMISPVLISFMTFVLTYCRLILLSSLILLCIQFVVTRF